MKECSELPDHWWKISCCETLTDGMGMSVLSLSQQSILGQQQEILCSSAHCICVTDICLTDVLSVLLVLEVTFSLCSYPVGQQNKLPD